MTRDNPEDHDRRHLPARDEDPMSSHSMRISSPLSVDEERVIHRVIGSAIAVHRALGPGFLESIYRKAMCIELGKRHLTYECERPIEVTYDEIPITGQRIDLIVGGLIIVESKAVARPFRSSWFKLRRNSWRLTSFHRHNCDRPQVAYAFNRTQAGLVALASFLR